MQVLKVKRSECWTIKEFAPIHNHKIVTLVEIQFLRSLCDVPDGLVAQVRLMNKVDIKTTGIMLHVACCIAI